jgi:hypothetical protein
LLNPFPYSFIVGHSFLKNGSDLHFERTTILPRSLLEAIHDFLIELPNKDLCHNILQSLGENVLNMMAFSLVLINASLPFFKIRSYRRYWALLIIGKTGTRKEEI